MATETAIIILCQKAILIWAIPTLSPQLDSSFFDDSLTHNPPPLFTIPLPDGIVSECFNCKSISSWYFSSSRPIYFDMMCPDSKVHRFQVMLKPDLSSASLHVINTYEPTPHDFRHIRYRGDYRICEDTLVFCWMYRDRSRHQYQCAVYTGLTSARFANVISHGSPATKMLLPDIGHYDRLFLCPASGRLVCLNSSNSVAVLDFF